ncbi:MAG TPA: hypothetical protein VEQ10_05740 [Vicinamibacteria bacterium]|nr:hypothetical protein [Vicinamibacteria bacterium]
MELRSAIEEAADRCRLQLSWLHRLEAAAAVARDYRTAGLFRRMAERAEQSLAYLTGPRRR